MFWLDRTLRLAAAASAVWLPLTACSSATDDSSLEDFEDTYGFDDGPGEDGGLGDDDGTEPPPDGGETGGGGEDGGDDGTPGPPGDDAEPGQLSAAEWRDLDHWDFWLGLMDAASPWSDLAQHWGFFTASRIPIAVTAQGAPLADAPVELLDENAVVLWTARTDNTGAAELFPGLNGSPAPGPFTIKVAGQVSGPFMGATQSAPSLPLPIDVDTLTAPPPVVDLMLVIDTTGSMADELTYLQVELEDVIGQVLDASGEALTLRLSVNFFRDAGDDYVVRSFPFTEDVPQALAQLGAQEADGGGDFPEAVDVALADAVYEHEWSEAARARLLFLVLDAPPHHDPAVLVSLHQTTLDAAHAGIRIIPVAGSGVDKPTEFLLRFIDIATAGTYVFLTDDSGIGGDHLEPTVGEYQVERLNALLVRLVAAAVK